jgi:hypothetical protein
MTISYDSLIKLFHILKWENGYNVRKMAPAIQESKPQKINYFNILSWVHSSVSAWKSFGTRRVPVILNSWPGVVEIMKFEVLVKVTIKSTDFWDAKSCHLQKLYRLLGETCCFHLQGRCLLSTVILETARSSATSINFCQITLRYVIEDSILLSLLSLWRSFNHKCRQDTSVKGKKKQS